MASTSETGHLKNITHFQNLIDAVTNFGAAYAPSNENITLAKLNDKKVAAENALFNAKELEIPLITARGARRIAFDPLRQTATRILAALTASGAPATTIKAAQSINRKIQGRRAPGSAKPDAKPAETISASQQSFDRQADFFQELILLLQSEPAYTPNEPELKITALTLFQQTLIAANKSVSTNQYPYNNSLIARDKVLYEPDAGLIDTAVDVKNYVKAVFGTNSQQYTMVRAIEFKKVN